MESFHRAIEATRLLFEEISLSHQAVKNISGALNVLKAFSRPKPIDGSKEHEIYFRRQDNRRTFKLVLDLYVITQQRTSRTLSMDNSGNIQDDVGQALDSFLHAFHVHPFAVSLSEDSQVDPLTFAVLNQDHETATRHEQLARRIGKAWVDDHIGEYNAQVQYLRFLQTLLFGLLWSGTVEQLKRHSPYFANDPERPAFEWAPERLEAALQEEIARAKEQRFTAVLCGMARAGKSLFLNALMGRAILPSDGETHDSCTSLYTDLHYRAPFNGFAMPCPPCQRSDSPRITFPGQIIPLRTEDDSG
jgi:hypothetical protein